MADSSKYHDFKAHATTAVAAGGAVYAADQLVKSFEPDDHSTNTHIFKASVGAAVAVGALELLRRDGEGLHTYRKLFQRKHRHHDSDVHQSSSESVQISNAEDVRESRLIKQEQDSSSSRSSSASSSESGHKRRLAEELMGAYSLGKQLLGDNKHKVAHLVADAVGAAALLKEINHHDLRNRK
ncbi:hypothetical protein N7533_011747 [Penicillium manginii]|jgi:hypothetical protein|uniref:uncharacterized protein n=1 Tax=Penicillium manginii TaxID=203109 RepID=UPI0025472314|nr:uncharacterized protein N7533_011747 [Penicillium manginii]KAJ5742338.1 hypothetical protein N7533_011747 [Penicillium manginii]